MIFSKSSTWQKKNQNIHANIIAVPNFCINYLFAQDPRTCSKLNCSESEILSVCTMNCFNRSLDIGVGSCESTEIQSYDNSKLPPVYDTCTIPDIMKQVFLSSPYQLKGLVVCECYTALSIISDLKTHKAESYLLHQTSDSYVWSCDASLMGRWFFHTSEIQKQRCLLFRLQSFTNMFMIQSIIIARLLLGPKGQPAFEVAPHWHNSWAKQFWHLCSWSSCLNRLLKWSITNDFERMVKLLSHLWRHCKDIHRQRLLLPHVFCSLQFQSYPFTAN